MDIVNFLEETLEALEENEKPPNYNPRFTLMDSRGKTA